MKSTNRDVFSAIADPTRRDLLRRLANAGEQCVSQLLAPLSVRQPTLSKHLRILREAGLVHSRKDGRLVWYQIDAGQLRQVHDWVAHFERYWDDKLDALGEHLDRKRRAKK
jgi:DNA-binding transcriptional ArsR family regulator